MRRDQLLELLHHHAAAHFRAGAMHEHRERIHRLGIDEDRHLHEIAGAIIGERIVEARIALRDRLQAIVEIEHDFVEWQVIDRHGALADIGQIDLQPAPFLAEFQHGTQIIIRRQDRGANPRLLDLLDLHNVGHVGRVVQLDRVAVGHLDVIDDRGCRRDEIEIEFAMQALLDDLQMQQAEEAAAEAEAQRRRGFHLVGEARIVEAQLAHGGAQVFEVRRIDGEETAEHNRLRGLEACERFGAGLLLVGDRVADARVGHLLDLRGDEADLARAELSQILHLRLEHADLLDFVMGVRAHHLDALALLHHAVDDAHQHDDAQIGVVPAVDQHGLQRRGLVALGRRQALDDGFQHQVDADAGLGRDRHGFRRVEADDVLDLLLDAVGLGGGQVDLVEHGHDLVAGIQCVVNVCQRLRLDTLGGIDHQQRAFAGRQRA